MASEVFGRATIDSGSYRDPSGFVFHVDEDVFRRVDEPTWLLMKRISETGLMDRLVDEKMLVASEVIDSEDEKHAQLAKLVGEGRFLSHERVEFISYPYEWSISMLAAAGQQQLDLQLALLAHGFSLKDATAYNSQFRNGSPIFIDLPSIEVPRNLGVWIAYGQFCRHFLFPLALSRYRNIDLKGYFLANMEGMSVENVYHVLGGATSFSKGLFLDVFLQRLLQRRTHVESPKKNTPSARMKMLDDPAAQMLNLKRLQRQMVRLARVRRPKGHWIDYEETKTYTEEGDQQKNEFVRDAMQIISPMRVLDIGCNTGVFSLIAEESGSHVVAIDSDHACVDRLFHVVRNKQKRILPLRMDIANMSPGVGLMNRERRSFMDRANFDCVLALAVVHHMLITSRLPLDRICELMARLTKRWLVVEFVGRQDSMFRQLLSLREDIYEHVTEKSFEEAFASEFSIRKKERVGDTSRFLYLMERPVRAQ